MQTMTRPLQAWTWPAMGTTWRLYHTGDVGAGTAAAVAELVHEDELRWSRFLHDSELSRMNRCAGSRVEVSAETIELLAACRRWTAATSGVFQPLVGRTLARWGYGHSMLDDAPGVDLSPEPMAVTAAIEIDADRATAWIPAGHELDLGGIAKSWSVVRAGHLAARMSGGLSLLIDGGGDLFAVRGDHVIDVAGPAAVPSCQIDLRAGEGAATSSTRKRRWRNGDGVEAHHLIDPVTGEPCRPAEATVCSLDPVTADVLATVLCLRPDMVDELDHPCRVVTDGGERSTAAWEDRCRR
jgi:thiamine biosynthesis lipoprotein